MHTARSNAYYGVYALATKSISSCTVTLPPGFMNRTISTEKPEILFRNLPLHRLPDILQKSHKYMGYGVLKTPVSAEGRNMPICHNTTIIHAYLQLCKYFFTFKEKFYLFLKKSLNIVVKVVQNTILMPFSTKRMHCINDIDSLLLHYIYNKSEMKQNIP